MTIFITGPSDKTWVNPREVFEVLNRLPVAPGFVTLSRSVDSGFTPLRFRFIADYLAALWEDRRNEQVHFASIFEYEARLRAGDRKAIVSDLRRELTTYEGCAATWYLLGLAEPDAAEAARCRRRAGELTDAYQPNLLRSICELGNRSLPVDLSSVLEWERSIASEAGSDSMERGLAWAALGLVHCSLRELSRAEDCYQRASAVVGEHPELAMEIGKLLAGSGRLGSAEVYLRAALKDDKSRTAAHFFISQIEGVKGLLDRHGHIWYTLRRLHRHGTN